MAWSENTIQVTFSGLNTVSVAAGGSVTSDAVTLSLGAVEREIRVKATGTAEADKTIEVHWLASGDVDADTVADDDTQGTLVTTLDVGTTPAVKSGMLVTTTRSGAIKLVSTAATNSYTVAVIINERIWQ